jgi:hypothetical protein
LDIERFAQNIDPQGLAGKILQNRDLEGTFRIAWASDSVTLFGGETDSPYFQFWPFHILSQGCSSQRGAFGLWKKSWRRFGEVIVRAGW